MDSRLSPLEHLDLLGDATARFTAALVDADPDAPAPALTAWSVGHVARHLVGVHRWCTAVVRDGTRPARSSTPAVDGDLVDAYRTAADELLGVLAATDPDRACWTMDAGDRRAGFWSRRQLHEVLVHLWDVRSAVDPTPAALADVPAEVCADGVDELLQMMPTRLGRNRAPLPGPLGLHATDLDRRWLLGPDWLQDGPALEAAASVRAPARELLLHVWGRPAPVALDGDPAVLRAFDRAPCR